MSFEHNAKVGEKVVVKHEVQKAKDGSYYLVEGKAVESVVTKLYHDGMVGVTSGDKWNVKRINGILTTTSYL